MSLSTSERLIYSTAKVSAFNDKKVPIGSGTGFFFDFIFGETGVPVLITNKHVINGADHIVVHVHLDDGSGNAPSKFVTWELREVQNGRIDHPDPEVDLTALNIANLYDSFKERGLKPFYCPCHTDAIPTQEIWSELTAMEDVVMVGYPNGLWDEVNNLPILRTGVTATHPKFNYGGKQEFMIDCACFPGSSGSPVFLFNEGTYSSSNGIMIGSRSMLLGVLFAGPQHTVIGDVRIVEIPTVKPKAVVTMPNNLGVVIKSTRILELEPLIAAKLQS